MSGQNVDDTLQNAISLAETVDYCRKGQLVVAVYELDIAGGNSVGANMRVLTVG